MRLAGKTAIVTGGSSGIGRSIAILFAKEGANVVIGDIRTDPREGGEPIERVIAEAGGTCRSRRCDVSRWDDVDELVTRSVAEFGKLDIMVNNAATFVGKKILETTEEDWDRVMATNAKGVFFGCKRAIQQMLTQKVVGDARGRIVNISRSGHAGSAWAVRSLRLDPLPVGRGRQSVIPAGGPVPGVAGGCMLSTFRSRRDGAMSCAGVRCSIIATSCYGCYSRPHEQDHQSAGAPQRLRRDSPRGAGRPYDHRYPERGAGGRAPRGSAAAVRASGGDRRGGAARSPRRCRPSARRFGCGRGSVRRWLSRREGCSIPRW